MNTFRLEIITPDKAYPVREIVSLDVPAEEGRLTILAQHQPFVCCLTGGTVKIKTGSGEPESWLTGPGTMKVIADTVTLLLQTAQPEEISRKGAEFAKVFS